MRYTTVVLLIAMAVVPSAFAVEPTISLTQFHEAVWGGDAERVEKMIKNGIDINRPFGRRKHPHIANASPLIVSIIRGHNRIADILLKSGADVEYQHNRTPGLNHVTPIMYAAGYGNETAVKLLITAGANVNHMAEEQETALRFAIYEGHEGIVKQLLDAGTDVNKSGGEGNTPLFLAAAKGQHRIVELLISGGANVNSKNSYSREFALDAAWPLTPLMISVYRGHYPVVVVLLKAGADAQIEMSDWRGKKTAFDLAKDAKSPDKEKIIKALRDFADGKQ